MKKLVRNQQQGYDVIVYFGIYESRSKFDSTDTLEYKSECIKIDNATFQTGDHPEEYNSDHFGFADHLGNIAVYVNPERDPDGDAAAFNYYSPFGELSYSWFACSRFRYCGKELDSESGLYYYGARYYAAWLCRFVSVDPLAYKTPSWSSYGYCEGNPAKMVNASYGGCFFFSNNKNAQAPPGVLLTIQIPIRNDRLQPQFSTSL
jgi:RHS repeat-associated protein